MKRSYHRYVEIHPDPRMQVVRRRGLVGLGVKVGIIDSGLAEPSVQVSDKQDFTVSNGTCQDVLGHGSLVAKIVKTYAPGVGLAIAKVANQAQGIEAERVIRALEWCVDMGVQVINLSLGFEPTVFCRNGKCRLCATVAAVVGLGIPVITAAGNSVIVQPNGIDKRIRCPAVSDYAFGVGAIDENGQIADYCSEPMQGQNKPDIYAPGTVIEFGPQNRQTGTSFATSLVTATCALC